VPAKKRRPGLRGCAGYRPRNLPIDVNAIKEMVSPKPPEGEEKLAIILEEKISQLAALDRYERRALSKRKALEPSSTAETAVCELASADSKDRLTVA